MSKFAKLFEIEEDQLLVLLQLNDKGYPEIRFMTDYDGVVIQMAPSFEPKNVEEEFNEDKAWALAQKGFDNVDIVEAKRVRSTLIQLYITKTARSQP